MQLLHFLDSSVDPSIALAGSYNPGLVFASILLACIASYAAFGLADRISSSKAASTRRLWLVMGAVAMGLGVWAMHFIGMLALRLPIPVGYDVSITLLSQIPAILAGGVVLHVISRQGRVMAPSLVFSGTLMGVGIGAMHYTGMSAMQVAAEMVYDPSLFLLSVIVAVALATLSLYARLRVRDPQKGAPRHQTNLIVASIMGVAISGMHYTGMAAVYFLPSSTMPGPTSSLDPTLLGILVSVASIPLLALVIFVTAADARIKAANAKLAHEAKVAQSFQDEAMERAVGPLLGESISVRALRESIAKHAAEDYTVLLTGPTGAGQEAVARAIHHASPRREEPFIHVNCTRLRTGDTSGLFGLLPADSERNLLPSGGKFGLADHGTLFLENVDKLSSQLQDQLSAILGTLEQLRKQNTAPSPDVRVVAYAPNTLTGSEGGSFLSRSLLQALSKHQLSVPSLAERREDIPELARYFVKEFAHRFGKSIDDISEASLERLQSYRWPGNVQEMRNLLERLVVSASGTVLEVDPSVLEEGIPLDRYRLVQKLGSGGMGEVWLAKHQLLARPAAVKLIRADVTGTPEQRQAAIRRFQREAQITANLNSPNTVRLYDFGVSESGSFYLVMELLNGLNLDSLVDRFGPVPPERTVMLMRQICRSLGEAHGVGLVHRDIKPANIFICKMGQECDFIKVLDFGIVKDVGQRAGTVLTDTGKVVGTPAFMAPESILGGKVDRRADLYAVGCVGYWLLTGRLPFESENAMQMLAHHAGSKPTPPSESSEFGIPDELDQIILACLEKRPEGRPDSADTLWNLLGQVGLEKEWTHGRAESWWKAHMPNVARRDVPEEGNPDHELTTRN